MILFRAIRHKEHEMFAGRGYACPLKALQPEPVWAHGDTQVASSRARETQALRFSLNSESETVSNSCARRCSQRCETHLRCFSVRSSKIPPYFTKLSKKNPANGFNLLILKDGPELEEWYPLFFEDPQAQMTHSFGSLQQSAGSYPCPWRFKRIGTNNAYHRHPKFQRIVK